MVTRRPRQVDRHALQAFASIMRTGSVTAAARELALTQPAVSRILASLEEDLGFELFWRDKGRLIATKDGLLLAEEVELALAGMARVDSLIRDIAGYTVGELKLVAPPSFAETILPDIAVRFLNKYPGVRLSFDSRSVETAKTMIATRVVDGGFLKLPIERTDLHAERIIEGGTACVLTAEHALANEASLTPKMLAGYPLVLLGAGRDLRGQIDRAFREAGCTPTVAAETHTVASACALAMRGVGIAIVAERLAMGYVNSSSRLIPLSPPITQDYAFVWSALSAPTRLAKAFMECAIAYGHDQGGSL